ncbi:MAG TPA: outer membrane beta-barrel protein, partial [Polyangium sp.]|nr:outer membrane beta-barrel protein [Polyangium sp.]
GDAKKEEGNAKKEEGDAKKEEGNAKKEEGDEKKEEEEKPLVTFHGTVELSYLYNLNNPSNGTNAWRYYDFRHNVIGLQSAMLTTEFEKGPVSGTVQLQLGAMTEVFWDSGRGLDKDLLWRLLQQVTAKWTTPHERLSIEGGAFNVPFGAEWNATYLNWTWSTGNLFALMPYQIGGIRANYDLGKGWTARAGVYNGWDQIVIDNNRAKSFMFSLEWEHPDDEETYFYFNYMVGNERDTGDSRGPYARHTFDVYGQWHATDAFFIRAQTFSGLEPTHGSTIDGWFGGALTARVDPTSWLSLVARGDIVKTVSGTDGDNLFFADTLESTGRSRTASTLMGSVTGTVDVHPASNIALRLEARHDRASFPLFYKGNVTREVGATEDTPNALTQTTFGFGMTTWF